MGRFFLEPPSVGKFLSKENALTLIELMHRCISCGQEADFLYLFSILQELLPFDFACTLSGCGNEKGVTLVDGINISYPDEFCWAYMEEDRYQKDTVVKAGFETSELQTWNIDGKGQHRVDELVTLAAEFGMHDGFAQGVQPFGSEKYGSVFVFANRAGDIPNQRSRAILDAIAPHLHLALSRTCHNRRVMNHHVPLTSREKEVLDWVKQGKSSWDTSVILNISERTVNFHVRNIMQKLGTVNRAQTVAAAAHLGLIDCE